MPSVAVVVPCRNEERTIGRLLDAIAAQQRPPDEVVVVNDASTDGTLREIAAWRQARQAVPVRVIEGRGAGAAAAMNDGIRAASADIIVRLDGHCRPAPDYVRLSLESLARPGAGVVGGLWRIEPGDRTRQARAISAVLAHPLGTGGAAYRRVSAARVRAVDTVPFGAFRKAVWEEVGQFDETLLRNQDYDFNYRVRLRGLEVVLNPAILSVYTARPTLRALARQYFDYGFWKAIMLRKFPESIRLRQGLPFGLLPVLTLASILPFWAGQLWPLAIPGAYAALILAAAMQLGLRAGVMGLVAPAAAAFMTVQICWSAGAWWSVLRGPRAVRR